MNVIPRENGRESAEAYVNPKMAPSYGPWGQRLS